MTPRASLKDGAAQPGVYVLVALLAVLAVLARGSAVESFSHVADIDDTVRYNASEFGVTLHVPAGWHGRPRLLFLDGKDHLRAETPVRLGPTTLRARFNPGRAMRYAFWIDDAEYKTGESGLVLDRSGVHQTATPEWFEQPSEAYRQVKPPEWPAEGLVFYALDTDRFGDGTYDQRGAQSFTRNIDYIRSLGVNGVWLNAVHADSGDTVEDAHDANWRVVAEGATDLRGADGIANDDPKAGKGWRVAITAADAYPKLDTGDANGVADRRWSEAVYGFVRREDKPPSSFANTLLSILSDYPDGASREMVLRLGGPGQPRPATVLRADSLRLQEAYLFLMTLPGVPVIDAGDEIGLLDTDERMQWDPTRQDSVLLAFVRKLVQLRVSRPSLFRGDFHTLGLDDASHVLGFARTDRQEVTLVLVNNGRDAEDVHVPIARFGSADLRDLFASNTFTVTGLTLSITVPARGFVLLGN